MTKITSRRPTASIAKIVALMRPRRAAKVLAATPPARAAELSRRLSRLSRAPSKEAR